MVNFFLYIFTILFISCEDNNKGPRIYKIYKNDSSSPIIEDSNIEKSEFSSCKINRLLFYLFELLFSLMNLIDQVHQMLQD